MSVHGGTVLIDCQINEFRDERTCSNAECPLCTGGIMEAVELTRGIPFAPANYYLPTVHAKFPLAERLASFRRRYQETLASTEETKEG